MMTHHPVRRALTTIGTVTAHPAAFLVVVLYAVGWAVFDRASLNWHGFAALVTLLMTLVIQRAEHRDTQAIHAKLDAILRAHGGIDDHLTKIDEQEPEDVEAFRGHANAGD